MTTKNSFEYYFFLQIKIKKKIRVHFSRKWVRIKMKWIRNTVSIYVHILNEPVFRIRFDPYHWAGSGTTSGNVDPDPGSKTSHIQINQNFKNIIFFLKKSLILLNLRE